MKNRVLPILSLLIALSALYISARNRVSQAEIDQRVELALKAKEKDYVHAAFPQFDRVYHGLLKPYETPKMPPDTFSELLKPASAILDNLVGAPSDKSHAE